MTSTMGHEHCLAPGCGLRLSCKASRARGYGWGCWRRIRAAAMAEALAARLAAFTARQIEQARELIEDAAIIPAATLGYTVSSDGTEIYLTAADICSCLASKECYHRAAVIIGDRLMTAAARPLTFGDALAAAGRSPRSTTAMSTPPRSSSAPPGSTTWPTPSWRRCAAGPAPSPDMTTARRGERPLRRARSAT